MSLSLWFCVLRHVQGEARIRSEPNDLDMDRLTYIYSMDRIINFIVLYTLENNSLSRFVTLCWCAPIHSNIIIHSAATITSMICVSEATECNLPLPHLTRNDGSG